MAEGAAGGALRAHVRRFNQAVRSGDFSEMLEHLHADAEMTFLGVDTGPFVGRDAIAAAYRDRPPDDEIVLLVVHADDDAAAGDYAWRAEPQRPAGRISIRVDGGLIRRLDISFVDGQMGDA